MKYLVTGVAGFIGFHTSRTLLERGHSVAGVDNVNDYYDPNLKEARLKILTAYPSFIFHRTDVSDREGMEKVAAQHPEVTRIIHLAAQAGLKYSLINPYAYIQSNINGQLVMLELARNLQHCEHFVYASSSSVYGSNKKMPFSVEDRVDHPLSLYAASKKSCELMAYSYGHLYGIPTTGLRFFTVYGPWGRPDMAAFIFAKAILKGEPIHVYNHGDMRRDFTYIDDIVDGILKIAAGQPTGLEVPANVYNIGNHRSEALTRYISIIEKALGMKANIVFEPMRPGDVKESFADIQPIRDDFGFEPKTTIDEGIPQFIRWYRDFYAV